MGAGGGINIPINVFNTGQSPAQLAADVNKAIGAFREMGRVVETTSASAVAAYRQQGEALYLNLLTLGRTTTELNQVAAAITRTEQAYGAQSVAITQNTGSVALNATGARRGASAIATLAFAMQGGAGSARGMAVALGSAAQSMASMSTEAKYASLGPLAALVVLLGVLAEVLYRNSNESKRLKDSLGDLGKFNANQLQILAPQVEADYEAAIAKSAAAVKIRDDAIRSGNVTIAASAAVLAAIEGKHLDEMKDKVDAFRKALTESASALAREVSVELKKAQDDAAVAQERERAGPAAARRLQLQLETKEYSDELTRRGIVGQAHDDLMAARAREDGAKLHEINREVNEKSVALDLEFDNQRLAAEAKLSDDIYGVQAAAVERKAFLDKKRVTDDRDLTDDSKRLKLKAISEAATADLLNIEKNRSEQLLQIRGELQDKLDELADRGVDEAKIRARYKKEIDLATATIADETASAADRANAEAIITSATITAPREIAKARLDQTLKDDSLIYETQQQNIARIQALKEAGDISDEDARTRTIAALKLQYDAAVAALTELRDLAAQLPGNAQAQEDVQAYTTKVLQLGIAIAEASDRFRDLKQAGLGATQNAIATLAQSIPQVLAPGLTQSGQVAAIDQMKVHLASANAELQNLLKGPQTPAVTAEITALRAEIQNTNIELKNAQRELTTWKTLFLDAARSIVSALAEVSSKMLATLLIQDLLHGFGGGSNASAGASFVGDVVGAGVFAASGGMIRGPGTGTSDSIPARLSHGEYVVNARATARVGQAFLDSINDLGGMPRASRPSRIAHFADGGLVTATTNDATTSLHATLGLEQGLVLRHLESHEGHAVVLKVLSQNQNKIRAMLGSR